MKNEQDKNYEGLSPIQLKTAFWDLCLKLPPPVSDKDVRDAFNNLGKPDSEVDPTEQTLQNRANSELRKVYSGMLTSILQQAPITPTYRSFIVDRRFGSFYHWGIDQSQFHNPNKFPAYLIGLDGDNDNLGIFDPEKSKDIERSDYKEEIEDSLHEHDQAVKAFGQAAIDDLQERIRKGEHPEHPRSKRLNDWRKDFVKKYQEEP